MSIPSEASRMIPSLQIEVSDGVVARVAIDAPIFIQPKRDNAAWFLSVGATVSVLREQGEWTEIEFQDAQWADE